MHDLRLVGVHDDGEHVVLAGSDGSRYRLRVDEALRAAVRRDRARLGQVQIQASGELRPREIQARIRAGESAEEIAAQAGIPLANVRRYEGPVLAERDHVGGMARRTPFGRRDAAGAAPALEDLVVQRLAARAVDPEGVRWDAWRQEDGAWAVQVEFVAGGRGRLARWSFDVAARSLTAA
ncbi:septation protein SepH, partial [Kineococcus glutinatus]|uniref:septation protein SepH n=1 Tax=Kineococcus glutinatus TaxID=1070872 RepID=UPI0031E63ED8